MTAPRSIAINVGANTNMPGIRGPIYPDGRFEYLPIPEEKATSEPVPTYTTLDTTIALPEQIAGMSVHLDPEFAEYPCCERYTYGDEHGVKAGPLSKLDAGDFLYFYATLTTHSRTNRDGDGSVGRADDESDDTDDIADWIAPEWGTYLIGRFRVARAVTGEEYDALSPDEQAAFANNAHVKRDPVDAKVLVEGDDSSRLFDYAVPLSSPDTGATANRLVTELSNDSGKGPWWRRRFWYDSDATEELRRIVDDWPDLSVL